MLLKAVTMIRLALMAREMLTLASRMSNDVVQVVIAQGLLEFAPPAR